MELITTLFLSILVQKPLSFIATLGILLQRFFYDFSYFSVCDLIAIGKNLYIVLSKEQSEIYTLPQ